jgi:hypothetical protein
MASVIYGGMCTEHWWNDADRGKPEVRGEKLVPVPLRSFEIPHGPAWN